ncbi:hypothetical protein IE81DRAFT_323516 [Ceraceosorus guamensis]|uniref:PIN domain-like protein n=1 Tax=Ceraceosorus guamensis TaxID=1522189 RepID=A0A316VZR6_9BASI|nr:hypothetical protein IE81DRAFT_323516 [Ceraceosorus guamensis]PWN42368.1 hypothetical protein IE81DRAFT_323516 [Ceraceosorus guamensis]
MGVRNLSSFAQENARLLCETLSFSCQASSSASLQPSAQSSPAFLTVEEAAQTSPRYGRALVVDALAHMFAMIGRGDFDVARGGDYALFVASIQADVNAWRAAGLHPIFVFDGPNLPAKLPRQVSRRQQAAKEANLYMRSPPASRSISSLAPPLLSYAMLDALQHTTPPTTVVLAETEADGVVVELAHTLKGHAVSEDSDYFVLCARGDDTSYVPLSSFEYVVDLPTDTAVTADASSEPADEAGFETVPRRRRRGRGPAPALPSSSDTTAVLHAPPTDLSMLREVRFGSYSSAALARLLDLPVALLPLFAALAGNDYLPELQARILFEPFRGSERLKEAAAVLRRAWLASANGKKAREMRVNAQTTRSGPGRGSMALSIAADTPSESGSVAASSATATPLQSTFLQSQQLKQVDPVRALVQDCVGLALQRAEQIRPNRYVSTGEKEEMVDGIVESAATYSLLTHSQGADGLPSPASQFFSTPPPPGTRARGVEAYRQAYKQGKFHVDLVTGLCHRVYIGKVFAEDPDQQSTQKFAAQEIREWAWAILFDTWGMWWARETIEEPEVDAGDDHQGLDHVAQALRRPFGGAYKDGEMPDDVISVNTESSEEQSESGARDMEGDAMLDPDALPNRPNSALADRVEDGNYDGLGRLKPPPVLTEYVRRLESVTKDILPVSTLAELLEARGTSLCASLQPLRDGHIYDAAPLLPAETKHDLYLCALKADTSSMRALPSQVQPLAACLRYIVHSDADRYGEKTAKMAWSMEELRAAVRSSIAALGIWKEPERALPSRVKRLTGELEAHEIARSKNTDAGSRRDEALFPTTRALHASTALQLVLEASYLFSQSLLVDQEAHPPPFALHDGPTFHAIMLKRPSGEAGRDTTLEQAILSAVLEGGLEKHLAVDLDLERRARRQQRKKGQSIARSKQNAPPGKSFSNRPPPPKNAFASLLNETLS